MTSGAPSQLTPAVAQTVELVGLLFVLGERYGVCDLDATVQELFDEHLGTILERATDAEADQVLALLADLQARSMAPEFDRGDN